MDDQLSLAVQEWVKLVLGDEKTVRIMPEGDQRKAQEIGGKIIKFMQEGGEAQKYEEYGCRVQ